MKEQVNRDKFMGKAGKKLPFTVPEGYFERFADRLQTRIRKNKKLPFTVPRGYFDEFAERLQDRMHTEERHSPMERISRLIRPQLATAAIIIGFIAITYTGIRIILNDRTTEPTVTEIAVLLDDCLYEMDDELLISTILEEEIEVDWINGGYKSDEIMDYLMEEEMDYTNLIEEYNIY